MSTTAPADTKPTGPDELPTRQPSREDLESAEVLNLLNKSDGGFYSNLQQAAAQQQQQQQPEGQAATEAATNGENRSEPEVPEYHSLEDSLRQHQTQNGETSPRENTTTLPQRNFVSTSSITGQVCR